MNNKGQLGVGMFISIFIGIIVAMAFFSGGITQNIGALTNTNTIVNQTQTFPASGSTITLTGQAASSLIVINGTAGGGAIVVPASNYTVTNYVVSNGQLVTTLKSNGGLWDSSVVKVSYISEPQGYETDAGGRAMIQLIAIFAALAVAIFALTPVLREKLFDMF